LRKAESFTFTSEFNALDNASYAYYKERCMGSCLLEEVDAAAEEKAKPKISYIGCNLSLLS